MDKNYDANNLTLAKFKKRDSDDSYISKILCNPFFPYQPEQNRFNVDSLDPITLNRLNEYQRDAVLKAMNNEISLIVGPPGTGKTTVGVEIVRNLLKHKEMFIDRRREFGNKKPMILICGPSNNAVDTICEALIDAEMNVARIVSLEHYPSCSDKIICERQKDHLCSQRTAGGNAEDTCRRVCFYP